VHPISLDVIDEGPLISVANVIHVDKDTAILLGSTADIVQDLISNVGPGESITDEPLDEEAIDVVLLKPTAMSFNGLGCISAVQSGGGSISVLEVGISELVGIVFSHIWPHIDGDGVLIWNSPSIGPVLPPVESTCERSAKMMPRNG